MDEDLTAVPDAVYDDPDGFGEEGDLDTLLDLLDGEPSEAQAAAEEDKRAVDYVTSQGMPDSDSTWAHDLSCKAGLSYEEGARDVVDDDLRTDAADDQDLRDAVLNLALRSTLGVEGPATHHGDDPDRAHLNKDVVLKALQTWAKNANTMARAVAFANDPTCQERANQFISLLEVRGDGHVVSEPGSEQMQWVHWDNTVANIGRVVQLDSANRIMYSQPTQRRNFSEDLSSGAAFVVIPNTKSRMVKATAAMRAPMSQEALLLRAFYAPVKTLKAVKDMATKWFELRADERATDITWAADHLGAMTELGFLDVATDTCCICGQGNDMKNGRMSWLCPLCQLHWHDSCTESASMLLKSPEADGIHDILKDIGPGYLAPGQGFLVHLANDDTDLGSRYLCECCRTVVSDR